MFSDLPREAVKPPPAQPTHRVAVHIPSQQDPDSDSDIEEVRHPHMLHFFTPRNLVHFFLLCPSPVIILTSFYSFFVLQLTAVKTIPKAAPRGEKVSDSFSFSPEAQNICSRNSFPCIYSEISFRNPGFHQGNILSFRPFFAIVTHLLITRCFL